MSGICNLKNKIILIFILFIVTNVYLTEDFKSMLAFDILITNITFLKFNLLSYLASRFNMTVLDLIKYSNQQYCLIPLLSPSRFVLD